MRKLFLCMLVLFSIIISGCTEEKDNRIVNVNTRNWDNIVDSSKGTIVNLYTYIDKEEFITYVDKYIKPNLKTEHDITLRLIIDDYVDIIDRLENYKATEDENGEMDLIWVEGSKINEFISKDYVFGPYTNQLPNMEIYLDNNKYENSMYYGMDLMDSFLPFGRSQMVLFYNEEIVDEAPLSVDQLMTYVKSNNGKFSYPEAKSKLGREFINTVIINEIGERAILSLSGKESDEEILNVIKPGIDVLKEMNPYLWNQGQGYPLDEKELIDLYIAGEINIAMSSDQFFVENNELDDFPGDTYSFVFDKGTVSSYSYLCIPYNSLNKSGAMVTANYLLNPDAQGIKYNPSNWGNLPVIDPSRLNDSEFKKMKKIRIKKYSIDYSEFYTKSIPNIPKELDLKIAKIWYNEVYKK